MKYILRTPEPQALNKARERCSSWKDLKKYKKDTYDIIVEELYSMQKELCAYCERKIKKEEKKYHVEHFRCRHQFPQSELEWNNLFLSCNHENTCGKHKDSSQTEKYNVDDLIKPDIEADNPQNYFTYTPKGKIEVNSKLNNKDAHKAEETIRVFNLNETALVNTRKNIFKSYFNIFSEQCNNYNLQNIEEIKKKMEEKLGFSSLIESILSPYNK